MNSDLTEHIRGESLAGVLNGLIDGMTSDDMSRSDIIMKMASAASISESTVGQILRAEITCPPVERLQGFATALGTSLGRLQAAAERDGCSYDRSIEDALEEIHGERSPNWVDLNRFIAEIDETLEPAGE